MDQRLENSWFEAQERYQAFASYVKRSDVAAPVGDLDYTQDLYSSWVLLAYAALESALSQFGKAVMGVLAVHAPIPDRLPDAIRLSHLKRTLIFANELVGASASRDGSRVDPEDLVKGAYSDGWAEDSILMRLDRNAWPSNVREWLERVGVAGDRLAWMKEPWEPGSETLESRVASLVQERNDLAHGIRPTEILGAEQMIDWADAAREFARRVIGCLQTSLGEALDLPLEPIGTIAAVALGPSTVPVATLAVAIRTGGHVICRDTAGQLKIAKVLSMQSDDEAIEHAPAGTQRLAITLNRTIDGFEFFAPI